MNIVMSVNKWEFYPPSSCEFDTLGGTCLDVVDLVFT